MDISDLTTGIELEFAVVYHARAFANIPGLSPKLNQGHVTAAQAIQHLLRRLGVDASLPSEATHHAPYHNWHIGHDYLNITEAEEARIPCEWVHDHIELSSRVFSFSNDDWTKEIQCVTDVLSTLRTNFNCAIFTNSSAGFHVHMGRGSEPIPLSTAKRIAQLFTAHESRFDQMHSALRILAPGINVELFGGVEDEGDFWCAPPSFFHRNLIIGQKAIQCEPRPSASEDENVFDWLQRIEQQMTYESLAHLNMVEANDGAKCGHHAAINFDNCFNNDYTCDAKLKLTIEFRQHIGTVDFRSIIAWVKFLGHVVNYCNATFDDEFLLLLTKATDVNFTLDCLLTTLGCEHPLVLHFLRLDNGDEDSSTIAPSLGNNVAFITEPEVRALVDNNDNEQSKQYEHAEIMERCDAKYTEGYYGLDPTAAAFPFETTDIHRMLAVGWSMAEAAFGQSTDPEHVESRAKAAVFNLLATTYARLDNSLDPRSVIQWEFDDWVLR